MKKLLELKAAYQAETGTAFAPPVQPRDPKPKAEKKEKPKEAKPKEVKKEAKAKEQVRRLWGLCSSQYKNECLLSVFLNRCTDCHVTLIGSSVYNR